jgi:hypothetical protein
MPRTSGQAAAQDRNAELRRRGTRGGAGAIDRPRQIDVTIPHREAASDSRSSEASFQAAAVLERAALRWYVECRRGTTVAGQSGRGRVHGKIGGGAPWAVDSIELVTTFGRSIR